MTDDGDAARSRSLRPRDALAGPGVLVALVALLAFFGLACGESPSGRLPPDPDLCCPAEPTDWPRPGGPGGTGRIEGGPDLAEWSGGDLPVFFRREIGRGRSGVVVQGSRLVSAWAQEGYELVFCLDRRSGSMLWHVPLAEDDGGPGPLATPIFTPDGRVVAVGSTGVAVAVDAQRGREVWRKDLAGRVRIGDVGGGYAATPVFERGMVIFGGSERHALAALDARDGSLVWVAETGGSPAVPPVRAAVGDRVDVVVAVGEGLAGVDPETGGRRWIRPWTAGPGASLPAVFALDDGRLLVGEPGGRLTLLRLSGSVADPRVEEIWSDPSPPGVSAAVPGADGGLVLVEGGRMLLRDAATGAIRSSLDPPGPGWVVGVEGVVLGVFPDGHLQRFAATSLGLEGSDDRHLLEAVTGPPALSGGELFLRDDAALVGISLPVDEVDPDATVP